MRLSQNFQGFWRSSLVYPMQNMEGIWPPNFGGRGGKVVTLCACVAYTDCWRPVCSGYPTIASVAATALHRMQTPSSDENSVRLSVYL